MLDVITGQEKSFEQNFKVAEKIISAMEGYIGHELQRSLELPNRYVLLVKWKKLEDHTVGFRQSAEYQRWKQLLHHFYDPFPTVQHFEAI